MIRQNFLFFFSVGIAFRRSVQTIAYFDTMFIHLHPPAPRYRKYPELEFLDRKSNLA